MKNSDVKGFLVGIVLAAHNSQTTLPRAVDSVLNQTYQNWQLVIVDDGSRDSTGVIAEKLASEDERIRMIKMSNGGPANARNAGVAELDASWFICIDADDEFEPQLLATLIATVGENPGYGLYSSNGMRIYDDGREIPVFQRDLPCEITLSCIIPENQIMAAATLINRTDFLEASGFRGRHGEDYDTWLRMLGAGVRAYGIPDTLYRYHQDSATRLSRDKLKCINANIASLKSLSRNLPEAADDSVSIRCAIRRLSKARLFIRLSTLLGVFFGESKAESIVENLKALARIIKRGVRKHGQYPPD
ncbi:MAG: glycosyltransferase family 2 protein [Coriobacteriia bacterium]|nr:glycosyltransferase family 2 protein [Coriobacteriia bacterium]